MTRFENKASRLLQIEALLLAHPEGLSQAEIARRIGVHRSSVHRYLPDLTGSFNVFECDDGRLAIDRGAYLINVRFSLHEALAVHLAARLVATRMDRQNPHTAGALRKLGLALERLAPHLSRHLVQSADVMDGAGQRDDPAYLQALEGLTLAWAEQRKMCLWHHSQRPPKNATSGFPTCRSSFDFQPTRFNGFESPGREFIHGLPGRPAQPGFSSGSPLLSLGEGKG